MATAIKVPPPPGPSARSANMRANRRRDTGPEREVRSLLHRRGLRFRVDYPIVVDGTRVRPDIAFTRQRLAVFIDGCFWHGCPEHGRRPKVKNRHYWGPKIKGNRARDRKQTRLLEGSGWHVIRIWAHVPAKQAASQVAAVLDNTEGL